jgi:large subunit ribosomal protein L40
MSWLQNFANSRVGVNLGSILVHSSKPEYARRDRKPREKMTLDCREKGVTCVTMLFSVTTSRTATSFVRQHQPLIHTRNARKAVSIDPKLALIRSTLYPPNRRTTDGSPIGSYRPDVGRALSRIIQNQTVHETIERAWKLHLRHIRKFNSMKRAMEELEKFDITLAKAAAKEFTPEEMSEEEREMSREVKGAQRRALDARIPGMFPRDMRVPTDTPPIGGWDHAWKPPQAKK